MYPCLRASVSAHMGAIRGITLTATIYEDDVQVCKAETHCKTLDEIEGHCDGYVNYDCGGGNRMDWKLNFMRFYSKKYGGSIPAPLLADGLYCCSGSTPPILLADEATALLGT